MLNIMKLHLLVCLTWITVTPLLLAGSFSDELEGQLVRLENNQLSAVPKGHLANKKIIALYYSAHWCPPCRAFTPGLVRDYKKLAEKYPQFELIFVSNDHSEPDMLEYMKWGKMPFPALKFGAQEKIPAVEKLSAEGIPYLVVVDADGKELAGRGNTDWIHPSKIMPELEKLLQTVK